MYVCRFTCYELHINVWPMLTGPVQVVNHQVEGWQAIQRMWRYSFTEWQGAQGYELQIPLIFDGFAAGRSQEHGINKFERLAEKLPDKPRTPVFIIDAGGRVPHDYTNDHTKKWVITTLSWDPDYITDPVTGQRLRQAVTANVWEWNPDQTAQSKNRLPTKPVPKTYRIKRGDTLIKIAVHFYGDGSRWRDIARLNHMHNPNHPRVGRVIKLPAR